jgi:uncharacterized protein YdeI (YjbR/CyaY-like superfamily)
MTKDIQTYFASGCGRCTLFDTPQCKVQTWHKELELLREIVLESSMLLEEMKWGMPCYSVNKKNVLMLAAFKEYCSLSFFKGSLLSDPENVMVSPGENSQAVKQFKFKSVDEVLKHRNTIKSYIFEAIENEKNGVQITFKKPEEYPIPEEFQKCMNQDEMLREAFYRLTPGRRRAYLLHFGQAKQSATREARIEKCRASILLGKGLNE